MNFRSLWFGSALGVMLISGSTLGAEMAGGAITTVRVDGHHVLADARGRTLYTYDLDQDGLPTCSGLCAIGWPWMKAAAGAQASGNLAPVQAKGGTIWAYKGHPLYRYAGDHKAGDVTGDGVGGIWHVVVVN